MKKKHKSVIFQETNYTSHRLVNSQIMLKDLSLIFVSHLNPSSHSTQCVTIQLNISELFFSSNLKDNILKSVLTWTFAVDFIDIGGRGTVLDSLVTILTLRDWSRICAASDFSFCRLLRLKGLAFLNSISFADGCGGKKGELCTPGIWWVLM